MVNLLAEVLGAALVIVAMVFLAVGTPMAIVFTILAANHRKSGPKTWRDSWRFNPNNLIFFPDRLDEQGQLHAKRARSGFKLALIGAVCAFLAEWITTVPP